MPKTKTKTSSPKRARKRPTQSKPKASDRRGRALEAALAALAHDIRTPLGGILALSELLAASDLGERERQWALSIKSTAEHLASLTTLLIDAVKAETAGLDLREVVFRPREMAEAVAALLNTRAQTKGLEAQASIAGDLPELVVGDPVRLRAGLENLVDNAVKFTLSGTVGLDVSVERAARKRLRLVFSVTDSGIGLTPAEIRGLLRPFAQANEKIAREFGGSGLGLVSVKRLAKAMGGDLTIRSVPGRGSTFRLSVLVHPPDAAASRPGEGVEPPAAVLPQERSLYVLCAEDNPYGRVVLNTILGELGHRTQFVSSGEAALEEVSRGAHDVVLMDVMLSGMDGIEATRRIRALPPPIGRIPVIGISGRGTVADEEGARDAGMNVYLTKPLHPRQLAEALAALTATGFAASGQ
jgi:two-component system, sensor histidine kinase